MKARAYSLNLFFWVKDIDGELLRITARVSCVTFGLGRTFAGVSAEGLVCDMILEGDQWCEALYEQVSERIGRMYRVEQRLWNVKARESKKRARSVTGG
jgi:hypothetical protein